MKEKSSPVVESAVCGVLTELAAVSVRLHKQPGGGGDRSDDIISGGQSFGGDRSGETISGGQSFGGDTGCFCYCSSQFSVPKRKMMGSQSETLLHEIPDVQKILVG